MMRAESISAIVKISASVAFDAYIENTFQLLGGGLCQVKFVGWC